jgi:glycosyltransferase involved in cell wall biosynthesis
MPLRIVHFILEPRYSGAEILVLGLVRAQLAQGMEVAIVALRPSEAAFQHELNALSALGCELFLPPKPLVRQQRLSWIRRVSREFRPDVIFAHSLIPSMYGRLALIGTRRIAFVTVLHTDDDFANSKARAFERLMWRRNAVLVGVSPASLRNYRSRITDRIVTRLIANGTDLDSARAATSHRTEVRERLFQAAADEIILLQVGRISPQKQQRLSVEALASLGRIMSLDKVRLVFAGILEYKEYYEEVAAAAQALGVAHRIQFLGSRTDIPLLLAGADAHLMPSGWEAHSIAAIEALASGIFCFFTPIESFLPFREMAGVAVLPPDCTGEQFADAVAEAMPSLATSQRYVRDMEQYSFGNCARAYSELAQSLAAHAGDP